MDQENKILNVKHLHVEVQNTPMQDQLILLNDINFHIGKGEILGITGESGSGKSMIGRSIMGLASIHPNFNVQGKVNFLTKNLMKATNREWSAIRGSMIAIALENPSSAFNPLIKVSKQILESFAVHQTTTNPNAKKSIYKAMDALGLVDHERILNAYPHELSGGQLQRLLLISSTINKPKLLILDEGTSQLDDKTVDLVIDYLSSLRKESGMSLLFISHDLKLLTKVSDRILMIKDGCVIDDFLNNQNEILSTSDYTQRYLNHSLIPIKSELVTSNETILMVKNITKSFSKYLIYPFIKLSTNTVLNKVTFELKAGEILGIMGPSGSGKSTLAKIIVKLIIPDDGKISLLGIEYNSTKPSPKVLSESVQMLFQDAHSSLNPLQKVKIMLGDVINIHWPQSTNHEEVMKEALDNVGLSSAILDRYPSEMSGGQKHRVCIARALLCKPKVLILDESLSALDIINQMRMVELLLKLRQQFNLSILFIAHDLSLSQALCDRILTIANGELNPV